MNFTLDKENHLKWESILVPTSDNPSYRIVQFRRQRSRNYFCLVRSNDGEPKPSESEQQVSPKPQLSLTAIQLPYDYILVGSATGIVCFYLERGNQFILWNPSTGSYLDVPGTGSSCSAFAFYRSISPEPEFIIIAISKSTAATTNACQLSQFSTGTGSWELLVNLSNDIKEALIEGSGFIAGTKIYWGSYYLKLRLDSVVVFDMVSNRISLEPTNAPVDVDSSQNSAYSFMSILTHAACVNSEVYFILQRRSGHCSDLFRLSQDNDWIFICETSRTSYILDIISGDRLLVHSGSTIKMVDIEMKTLSTCACEATCHPPFVVLHVPTDLDIPFAKGHAGKKPSFGSKVKSVLGMSSPQTSPRKLFKGGGSTSKRHQ